MSEPLLAVRGVTAFYGRVMALKGVDLDVHAGEIVTLIGANGAGKSTLMMTICGNPRAREGSIKFDGAPIGSGTQASRRRAKREMQMIFQDPTGSIDPRWTIEEVIAEPLVAHERADRAIRRPPPKDQHVGFTGGILNGQLGDVAGDTVDLGLA